jgi:hypothetical protein
MQGQGTVPNPTCPQGGVLVEVLLALLLLAISGTGVLVLLSQSLRQARVSEQVSELLPSLSEWIVEASPGDDWTSADGARVRWDPEGWIRVDLSPGIGRAMPWGTERMPEGGVP